ncbi:hypothetical protein TUM3794_20440 [Shewanella colwelliana]|uniref:Uncharacterized protein n=1 Tax=Shewanella colwelliana TaxID=23 RepID=A0ABQ4P1G6_SHECO|nr:hypothetical protein [Shewanella colwelliana]GIU41022.1 hypothetical protein TUM3794_20440 [Shewanella colwelliana]
MIKTIFLAKVTDSLSTWNLTIYQKNTSGKPPIYFVYRCPQHGSSTALLDGTERLQVALALVDTISSEPHVSVVVEQQLSVLMPTKCLDSTIFHRPSTTTCLVIEVKKGGYTLAIDNEDLSKTQILTGTYHSIEPLGVFDRVEVDLTTGMIFSVIE